MTDLEKSFITMRQLVDDMHSEDVEDKKTAVEVARLVEDVIIPALCEQQEQGNLRERLHACNQALCDKCGWRTNAFREPCKRCRW